MSNLSQRLRELELENLSGLEKAERLSLEELESVKRQREYEQLKFDQFKRIIEGERYFRLEHINRLNIDYHIAIKLSAKNIGKTTELYRQIKACLDRGKKFIYGRVTMQELETEVDKFREDAMSPVMMLKHGTKYYYFRKEDVREFMEDNPLADAITYTKLMKAGYEYVGRGMAFMNSNILGSGNYADYEMIFFDEIVPYTPKQHVNERILYNWGCAISTILRNKTKMTIIMMGNLQNNITSVPILDYYGIDISDNLRIIERSMEGGEPCRILYINSGSLYNNSLKNQAAIAHHASLDDRLFMEHNKVINSTVKIMDKATIGEMDSRIACAMEWDDCFWVLELRGSTVYEEKGDGSFEEKNVYALCVHPLSITTVLDVPIYTNELVVSNKFSKVKYIEDIEAIYRYLYTLFSVHILYYDSNKSLDVGGRCMDDVIRPYLEVCDVK